MAETTVVASIKPVHSLVAAVMQGVGEPVLLVKGTQSPHGFSLKPSDAKSLAHADVVFWLGPGLETFLEKPLQTLASKARAVDLGKTPGLIVYTQRNEQAFDAHAHEGADPAHGTVDPHVWLDPENAKRMVGEIVRVLSQEDAGNAARYEENARAVQAALDGLVEQVGAGLESVADRPFIVFHDAYQYFERRFGLTASGSLTLNPQVKPGAGKVRALQRTISDRNIVCIFIEPQFDATLARALVSGTNVKIAVLDPLGAAFDDGPELYFKLIRGMADTIRGCLAPAT